MDTSHLQPIQQEAISKTLYEIINNNKRICFVMPPASGQTVVSAAIINGYLDSFKSKRPAQVLVITHGIDVQHSVANLLKYKNGLYINMLIKPLERTKPEVLVLPITTLSISGTLEQLEDAKKDFDLIYIIGGNQSAPSLNVILDSYPDAIQVSANNIPEVNERFGDPILVYTLKQAIQDSFLFTPYRVSRHQVMPEELKESFADLSADAIERVVIGNKAYIEQTSRFLVSKVRDQKTLVYLPTVAIAENFAAEVNKYTETENYAVVINHNIDVESRKNAIETYRNSQDSTFMLCLVSANATGIDLSPTLNVAIFRKTDSLGFLQNMIIPGLKPYSGKKELHVLDFVGLESLFSQLEGDVMPEDTTIAETDTPPTPRYFENAHIAFRDKKDIEGVLDVDDLAEELAEIVNMMPAEQGSMIGIFGKWGRGKTFLMDQTWKKLDDKKNNEKFIRVDFHAWKYQDTPATWAYLYECLSEKYFEPKSESWICKMLSKAWKLVSLNLEREKFWPLIKLLVVVFMAVITVILGTELTSFLNDKIQKTLNIFGVALISSISIITMYNTFKKDWSSKAKDLFLKYGSKHSFKEHLGLQAEIQKETITLLKTWIPEDNIGKKKIVLFVEDIDRCIEEKIIQIIDSLRVLLEDPEIAERVIIITAVDDKILKFAIKTKYRLLIESGNNPKNSTGVSEKLVNEYIDKLFIAGLKLGELSTSDADEFLLALTKNDRANINESVLQELLDADYNDAYSRQSQSIQNDLLMHHLEQAEFQDEYIDYEEPDLAPLYLENSKPLPDHTESSTTASETTANVASSITSLTNDEIDILRVAFTKYYGATPRQIRILYYRYLIAKNILIRRYKSIKRTNVWQLAKNSKIMATLIVAYTVSEEEGILQRHLAKTIAFDDESLYHVLLTQETLINGYDYKELLKTLAVVIAY